MTKSAVFIVPAAYRDAANAFCAAQGWQMEGAEPGTFCVALTDGSTAPTHYACRPDLDPADEAMLASPPPGAEPLLSVMIWDIAQDGRTGLAHFAAVLSAHGLAIFEPGLP